MLGMESCQEFGCYVFLILAKLLSARNSVSAAYEQIFSPCLSPVLWDNHGNIPSLTNLLCTYFYKGFVVPQNNLSGVLGIFQKLNSSSKFDQYGMELLTALLTTQILENTRPFLPQILNLQFTRLQTKSTVQYLRCFCLCWSRFLLKHGPAVGKLTVLVCDS
jgi:exportin-2 (importin alpha re-exporter)